MTKKILHIAGCDKFIPPFVKIVEENFNFEAHEFFLSAGPASGDLIRAENISLSKGHFLASLKHYFSTFLKMHKADKVLLHGLFDIKIVLILFFSPWLLKKCHWIIWGGDLYIYKLGRRSLKWKIKEIFRRPVIKNMGFLVTYIKGDVKLVRDWYGAKGKDIECLMYPSNLFKQCKTTRYKRDTINIQIGNSADESNNHLEVLEKLLPFKDKDINIYIPLSYGSREYANKVISQGKVWFGDKLKPLTSMLAFEEYINFLSTIDIALFNNNRQQAMGNIITLLGLGKTVYIRSDTSQWQFFKEKGLQVEDVMRLKNLEILSLDKNIEKIKLYFSQENYLRQLEILFS